MENEFEIIKKILSGKTYLFSELVDKYSERIFYVILNITRDFHNAEDLTQDAFIKAYFSLSKFEGKSKFYTYLYRIAVNISLNFLNSQAREKSKLVFQDEIEINDDVFSSPLDLLEFKETQEDINKIIEKLSPKMRSVITLVIFENLEISEAAEILETNTATVTWRLFYARKLIKQELDNLKKNVNITLY